MLRQHTKLRGHKQFDAYSPILIRMGGVVAGGYPAWCIDPNIEKDAAFVRDFDVFCPTEEIWQRIGEFVDDTWPRNQPPIQVIYCEDASAENPLAGYTERLLFTFDFTAIMVAIDKTVAYNNVGVLSSAWGNRTIRDLENRELHFVEQTEHSILMMARVLKYANKGYRLSATAMQTLFNTIRNDDEQPLTWMLMHNFSLSDQIMKSSADNPAGVKVWRSDAIDVDSTPDITDASTDKTSHE